jgi:hypothetical protein
MDRFIPDFGIACERTSGALDPGFRARKGAVHNGSHLVNVKASHKLRQGGLASHTHRKFNRDHLCRLTSSISHKAWCALNRCVLIATATPSLRNLITSLVHYKLRFTTAKLEFA